MKNVFIYLLAFGSLVTSVLSITSKNPVISVIYLIATFVQLAVVLVLLGINFVGISYIVVYVGSIAVLFLFVIMMINVRRCAWLVREIINLNPYSDRVLTTELGRRENRRLNIASLIKGIISSNRKERVEFRVNLSMVKAILLEVYTIEVPHHGLYQIREKIYTVLLCPSF
jgi:NADH-ubiquinone/plastoquinone oxidoreductase chain 6